MADSPGGSGSHESGGGGGGDRSPRSSVREQDRFLPIANIGRIMKKALPTNGKIAKDAKDTVQECVSEFISFVTSEASDKCQKEKRKTVNGDDLLWAMATLGFEDYIAPLKAYLARYREVVGDAKGSARGGDGSGKKDMVGTQLSSDTQVTYGTQLGSDTQKSIFIVYFNFAVCSSRLFHTRAKLYIPKLNQIMIISLIKQSATLQLQICFKMPAFICTLLENKYDCAEEAGVELEAGLLLGYPNPCRSQGKATKTEPETAPIATGNTVSKVFCVDLNDAGKKQSIELGSNKTTTAKTKIANKA
ncbi:nuclear transcription factor Y subunit B-1 isoform X1 [Olea europaea subsp. europaea]|uniref:Nuclear transcription factor Y subunit B-1 isoform X1 n=1 Tax=Olea europaea subsp. europaea TaxID=158383 RepID=A0A8S0VLI8_OLEEU|nr:nuclear transcription factor Y subunit B-1 isoform X1 [Olea europaea subsp. europaea]